MDLTERYHAYIACLNAREIDRLGDFVRHDAVHNGRQIGLTGYQEMLNGNYRDIPDLVFNIDLLVADVELVASRIRFDCRPAATFLDLPIHGRRVIFHENVFYHFQDGKIAQVWSVIDPEEIRRQL